MSKQKTRRRLERRPERQARRPGAAPRGQRQRSRTPVKVGSGGFNWTPVLAVLGVIAVGAIVLFAVIQSLGGEPSEASFIKAMNDDSPDLPGTYYPPHPGPDLQPGTADDRFHFGDTVTWPICTQEQIESGQIGQCYHSNPPSSGQHRGSPGAFRVYENPVPKENLLHTMEHGGVVIWYNTENQEIIDQLTAVAQRAIDRRRLVTMTPYFEMEPDTIALTAWTRLDKFSISEFDRQRIERFIETHQRRFNPEGF
jgi:hypothetical protein